MRLHPDVLRNMIRPVWLGIIFASVLFAAGGALFIGLQQDQGETSTTFVFGSRVGFDAPLDELEDHISNIVNSVEFGPVFERIDARTLLSAEDDYSLDVSIVENTQSVVAIEIRTDRSGEADRISRIVAEEMVRFVLEGVDEAVATDAAALERDLATATEDQGRLITLAGNVNPNRAEISLERQLAAITTDIGDDPVGTLEGELRSRIANIAPLAAEFRQTEVVVDDLERQLATIVVQRAEIEASIRAVSADWYRSVTPVEPTSNVPVAIAMAFVAAVPALFAAVILVALNLNRRLIARDRQLDASIASRVAAA